MYLYRIMESCYSVDFRLKHLCMRFNRRNLPGDKEKALEIMIPLVQHEDQVASDMYCLTGRIYKDMFLESGFIDIESRDKGIFW